MKVSFSVAGITPFASFAGETKVGQATKVVKVRVDETAPSWLLEFIGVIVHE